VVDGTAYIITNAPASAGDILIFTPANTTAYFAAQSAGGLTQAQVQNISPLMTNESRVIIGKSAGDYADAVNVGYRAGYSSGNKRVSIGYDSAYGCTGVEAVNIGYASKGAAYSTLNGAYTMGGVNTVSIGYYANGGTYFNIAPSNNVALGGFSEATNNSAALGAYVTNDVPGTTRVRGDLYLDGGTKIYTRETFNSGSFSEYGNTPFQEFSSSVEAVAGTATVVYASGNLVRIEATNNTEITFDNTDFPTNGVSRVWIELLAGAHTITFNESTITNAVAPTPSTENWTSLEFRRTTTNLWRGVQY
jgi:hypothetical protein